MKRLVVWLAILCLTVLSVSAAPYTDSELEEYMQAIYCEPVWTEDYPAFWVQFMDVDFDGRLEMLSVEEGEDGAAKQAHAYAFMDAELSHRGYLTIGKLDACRDTKTGETFMVNYLGETVQRLVYDPEAMLITAQDLSEKEAARLESYGYEPLVVTKAQCETIGVYEDCHALFMPAYQHAMYTNGEPPLHETYDYETLVPSSLWIIVAVIGAAAVGATVLWLRSKKSK